MRRNPPGAVSRKNLTINKNYERKRKYETFKRKSNRRIGDDRRRLHRCEPGIVLVLVRRGADSGGGMSDPFAGGVPVGDLRCYDRMPADQYRRRRHGAYHAGR